MGFPAFRTPRYARRGGVLLAAALASLAMAWASPAAAEANSTVDGDLFNLINQDRANAGVAPLRWSSTLGGIAESAPYGGCGYTISGRAQDLLQRNYFSHTILNCGSQTVFNMMQANGIAPNPAGENISFVSGIAGAGAIAQYLNTSFMNSPGHRANILNPAFTQVGVGTAYGAWSAACGGCSAVTIGVEDFAGGGAHASQPPPRRTSPPPPAPRSAKPAAGPHAPISDQRGAVGESRGPDPRDPRKTRAAPVAAGRRCFVRRRRWPGLVATGRPLSRLAVAERGGQTRVSVTSMLPRTALVYGQRWSASAMRASAAVRSGTDGRWMSSSTSRPKRPDAIGPNPTRAVTVESSAVRWVRRAIPIIAFW